MTRLVDVCVASVMFAIVLVLMLVAPTDSIERTIAYVLLVECPAIVLLALAGNAYLDWRVRR